MQRFWMNENMLSVFIFWPQKTLMTFFILHKNLNSIKSLSQLTGIICVNTKIYIKNKLTSLTLKKTYPIGKTVCFCDEVFGWSGAFQ